jgi:hypothetical protein
MTPHTKYVLLVYHLHGGPFHEVEYTYQQDSAGRIRKLSEDVKEAERQQRKRGARHEHDEMEEKDPAVIWHLSVENYQITFVLVFSMICWLLLNRGGVGGLIGGGWDELRTTLRGVQ